MYEEPNLDQINAVILQNDIAEVKNEIDLMVNENSFPVKISAFDLFCQKTGHKIGVRDQASLFALIKICGKDVAGNLYNATTLNVHPAWICSDPDTLDDLMEADPIGYAVFCLSLLTAQFYQTTKNQDPKRYPSADRLWALARANALLSQQGIGGITELNVELARMVSFMPDATNYFFHAMRKHGNTPDVLAMRHCLGFLTSDLHEATNRVLNDIGAGRAYANTYIKKTRFIDIAATPEDAARGPTNVRRQKASQRSIAEAAMFAELQKMFGDTGLGDQIKSENLPGSTAWRARMMQKEQTRESVLALELAALADVTNLAFDEPEIEDWDETTVEVRPMAQSIEEILPEIQEITEVIIEAEKADIPVLPPAPETAPKLTGLALIRSRLKKD